MFMEQISFEDWYMVKDNPAQRDTEIHAKKSLKNHLSKANRTHSIVSACRLESGEIYKLDGHTRCHLWEKGLLEKPSDELSVIIYDAKDKNECIELYKTFDNSSAVENSRDCATGALKLNKLDLKNSYLSKGYFTSALRMAEASFNNTINLDKKLSIYDLTEKWREELEFIDSINLTNKNSISWIISAIAITHRKNGVDCFDFWHRFNKGMGIKNERGSDGVLMLTNVQTKAVLEKQNGQHNMVLNCGRAISCFEGYKNNYMYKRHVKNKCISEYF